MTCEVPQNIQRPKVEAMVIRDHWGRDPWVKDLAQWSLGSGHWARAKSRSGLPTPAGSVTSFVRGDHVKIALYRIQRRREQSAGDTVVSRAHSRVCDVAIDLVSVMATETGY